MVRTYLSVAVAGCLAAMSHVALAADFRVLDSEGLVRAVRVVANAGTVTVTLETPQQVRGECVASNVDGLATEKRSPVTAEKVCVFKELPAGTWQIEVPAKVKWRVQIHG